MTSVVIFPLLLRVYTTQVSSAPASSLLDEGTTRVCTRTRFEVVKELFFSSLVFKKRKEKNASFYFQSCDEQGATTAAEVKAAAAAAAAAAASRTPPTYLLLLLLLLLGRDSLIKRILPKGDLVYE